MKKTKTKGEQIIDLQKEVQMLRESISYMMNMFQSFNSSVASSFRSVDAMKVYMNGSLQALESALCENTGLSLELYTKKFKEPCLQEQARLFEESYRRHMLSEGLNPETGEPLTEAELEELNEEATKDMNLEENKPEPSVDS